jgi:tetratricopeptide (TPR) repeat protein
MLLARKGEFTLRIGGARRVWRCFLRPRIAALVLCLILCPGLGSTAGAVAADAEALIRRGIELRRDGKDAEALQLFQQAQRLQGGPKALAQMGLAEQALGKWGAADRHLRESLQSAQDAWIKRNRNSIEDALKAIRGHVGQLDVRGSPPGAEVRIDGEPIGVLPFPAPVSVTAGGLAIEVRAVGHFPIVRASTVSVGALTRETFDLQSLPSNPAQEPASTPTPAAGSVPDDRGDPTGALASGSNAQPAELAEAAADSPPRSPRSSGDGSLRSIVAVSAAGLALVSATFGVVEHINWQNKASSFENTPGCDPNLEKRGAAGCQALYEDGKRAKALAFVGYGLAAGLATTALIVYLTTPTRGPDTTRVACAVNIVTAGVGCSMRF